MANPQVDSSAAVQLLARINKLNLKAFSSKTKQALTFIILNDTVQIAHYDRATLWSFEGPAPMLLGVSGQSTISKSTKIIDKWTSLMDDLRDPQSAQEITADSFSEEKELWRSIQQSSEAPRVQWLPIFCQDKLTLGIWVERWNNKPWPKQEVDVLGFLMQGYGIAWEKHQPKYQFSFFGKRQALFLGIAALAALFLIHVPLRIVAPCEIVPKDPIVITAPLNGTVEQMLVQPGQQVLEGDLLFSYDKQIPLQDLEVAQKQVQIIESELNSAMTLAYEDDDTLAKVQILALKLQKEQIQLKLAQYHASKLEVTAPNKGVIMVDSPEEWRGKPVTLGERVLTINNPHDTKIRIWLPESDNVILDHNVPLKVFLNISPEKSHRGKLVYISSYARVNDKGVPSFIAEAEWTEADESLRMGLKGSAILYGEDVTLFYWMLRRPWAALRNLIGL
ncbi:MAG: hypothetical protein CMO81_01950 [Waddliaceae bacterium]|nr:hypothetical protein [Waddliaceae bacterium]